MLFLCPVASRTEQFRAIRSKLEQVRTGHFESHLTTNDNTYLCNIFRDEQPICERAILRKAGAKISVMETKILKVVRQGEAFSVQSSKQESGQIQKCNIVLRELGGSKFENEFVCTMLGNLAGCRFYEGDMVVATLRFSTHDFQGQTYQEILATDIVKLGK